MATAKRVKNHVLEVSNGFIDVNQIFDRTGQSKDHFVMPRGFSPFYELGRAKGDEVWFEDVELKKEEVKNG